MGTTLTGTTPANTYDSLIKVTDNGPLSGTAKYLSDGLGNDSVLALSTAGVGIGTTSLEAALDIRKDSGVYELVKIQNNTAGALYRAVGYGGGSVDFGADDGAASTAIFRTAGVERMRITSVGTVGINSTPPSSVTLDIKEADAGADLILGLSAGTGARSQIRSGADLATASNLQFHTVTASSTFERMRITSAGNVGIGTSSPASDKKLQINNSDGSFVRMTMTNTSTGTAGTDGLSISVENSKAIIKNQENEDLVLGANNSETQLVLKAGGSVGIGTDSPSQKLSVASTGVSRILVQNTDNQATGAGIQMLVSNAGTNVGNGTIRIDNTDNMSFFNLGGERLRIQSGGGISFNGDTAAANALDDYEEGTWTPQLQIGGQTTGITYTVQSGRYTKIGRQVSANCYIVLSSKGTNTGTARLYGLPFTIPNSNDAYSPAAFYNDGNITYTGQFQAYGNKNSTSIVLAYATEAGTVGNLTDSNLANNSAWMLSITYTI